MAAIERYPQTPVSALPYEVQRLWSTGMPNRMLHTVVEHRERAVKSSETYPGLSPMQRPARPFESLDWYREASRREYRSGNAAHEALRWLKSSRCFAFHVGMFALGITIALAINVARDPGSIWVDKLALGWSLLLLVHAAVVALIFAIGLLGTSEQRLPVYVPQFGAAPEAPASATPTQPAWPSPPPREETTTAEEVPTGAPPTASRSATWRSQMKPRPHVTSWPTASRPADGETASWREASPAAWLKRKRSNADTPARLEVSAAPPDDKDPNVD